MTNIETNGRISRRTFLKLLGLAGVLAGAPSCVRKGDGDGPGHGPMTCRTDPKTGRAVSVLGYGCMRWPPAAEPSVDGCPIDQDTVNRLVDYAMGHGVNYFDTAPIYCQG